MTLTFISENYDNTVILFYRFKLYFTFLHNNLLRRQMVLLGTRRLKETSG